MNKGYKKGILVFFILVFPSLFYVMLSTGEHTIVKLPYYGEREVDSTRWITKSIPDTAYYQLPAEMLTTFSGEEYWFDSNDTITTVISFASFGKDSVTYRVMQNVLSQIDFFHDKPDVRYITIFTGLDGYEKEQWDLFKRGYVTKSYPNWILLQTDSVGLVEWRKKLLLDSEVNFGTYRTLTLLDQQNSIRGYFDGKQYVENKRIQDGIKALRFLNFRPTKDEHAEE